MQVDECGGLRTQIAECYDWFLRAQKLRELHHYALLGGRGWHRYLHYGGPQLALLAYQGDGEGFASAWLGSTDIAFTTDLLTVDASAGWYEIHLLADFVEKARPPTRRELKAFAHMSDLDFLRWQAGRLREHEQQIVALFIASEQSTWRNDYQAYMAYRLKQA